MKRFSRCALILIFITVIGGIAGFFYENNSITPMYESTTQLYVIPGEENEASLRAADGGLNEDFSMIFKSSIVIDDAKKIAGTSESIEKYISVKAIANSNIIEIKCTNPDQKTAKKYVDAVAQTALRTTSIIPVKSIQILYEGTQDNNAVKPNLYRNTVIITAVVFAAGLIIEIIILLFTSAFRREEDNSDDTSEYYKKYGDVASEKITQKETQEAAEYSNEAKKHISEKMKYKSNKGEMSLDDIPDILAELDELGPDVEEENDSEIYDKGINNYLSGADNLNDIDDLSDIDDLNGTDDLNDTDDLSDIDNLNDEDALDDIDALGDMDELDEQTQEAAATTEADEADQSDENDMTDESDEFYKNTDVLSDNGTEVKKNVSSSEIIGIIKR